MEKCGTTPEHFAKIGHENRRRRGHLGGKVVVNPSGGITRGHPVDGNAGRALLEPALRLRS